jgi:antitoxin YefM
MLYIIVYMKTVAMAYARANMRELLESVRATHERVFITRNGDADVVLMAAADLEALEETLEILSDPDSMEALREGRAAVEAGDTVALEDVLREHHR